MNNRSYPSKSFASLIALAVTALALPAMAGQTRLGAVKQVKDMKSFVEVTCENGALRVSDLGNGTIRVRAATGEFSNFPSFAVIGGQPAQRSPIIESDDAEAAVLGAGPLKVKINKANAALSVLDDSDALLIDEPSSGGPFFDGEAVGCDKLSPKNEHYYGFGEKTGPLDKRGQKMVMWNTDKPYNKKSDPMYQSHPFFVALKNGKAYGLFFDNSFKSYFDMAASNPGRYSFSADGGELDYYVMAGPGPREVLTRYGELTGMMNLPPLWGLGYHQCRWSYETAERVREIRDGFKKNGIPIDALYLDIHYMEGYRVFTFNKERFPDPAGLIAELKKDGIKTVVIVDPGVKIDPDYDVYKQMMENKYYVYNKDGEPFTASVWPGPVHFPDFYRPDVRQWWGDLHKFYTDLGVAGFWNDMNEPAGSGKNFSFLNFSIPLAPARWLDMRHGNMEDPVYHARIHNVYALLEAEATYNGLLRLQPDTRPFVISRAGYPGLQRYSMIWTGDNTSSWSSMRVGIPMLMNLGMSGQAFVGADIGGFSGAPSKELYARWIQNGSFSPFCRTHTAANMPDQEPWSFGDRVTDIARQYIKLRYKLLPYLYTVFEEASRTGWPIMRPLVFEFPKDEAVAGIEDQFMIGDWIMAAPVLKKGMTSRKVYLPKGGWYDFYTGERIDGPAEIEADAPLETMPLFVRAGAVIPTAPPMMNTGEKPWDPLTMLVFPDGASSSFTLYEDDGQSFAYRNGEFARTTFTVRDIKGGIEIEVGKTEGKFDPHRKSLEFKVFGINPEAKVECISEAGKRIPEAGSACERTSGVWLVKVPWDGEKKTVRIANP